MCAYAAGTPIDVLLMPPFFQVKLDQGLQMLKLFKEHVSKTSILDDFLFYEVRQKTMQERRAKQQQFQKQAMLGNQKFQPLGFSQMTCFSLHLPGHLSPVLLQVWDGKAAGATVADEVDGVATANGKLRLQKPADSPVMSKEPTQVALGELKPVEENGVAAALTEKRVAVAPNGVVANGC